VADEPPVPQPILGNGDVTALMSLINSMLQAMEYRILQRLDTNSIAAAERWAKHDAELEQSNRRTADRFERMELALEATNEVVQGHLRKQQDAEIRMDARVRPIRGSLSWLWLHWRDIVLLVIGMIALGTFLVDAFGHAFGIAP
jgi:hypothetical protein